MAHMSLRALLCAALLGVMARAAPDPSQPGPATDPSGDPPSCDSQCAQAVGVPVCGMDGQFYPNTCMLKCTLAAVRLQGREILRGECGTLTQEECAASCIGLAQVVPQEKPANCPAVVKPVCTQDGGVYGNICEAQSQGKEVTQDCGAEEGCARICFEAMSKPATGNPDPPVVPFIDPPGDPLPGGDPLCPCDAAKAPVCGVSGRIHDSRCVAEKCMSDKVLFDCPVDESGFGGIGMIGGGNMDNLLCEQKCRDSALLPPDPAICSQRCASLDLYPEEKGPVCTYTGEVLPSACEAGCRNAGVRFSCNALDEQQCEEQCKCINGCPQDNLDAAGQMVYSPVCGASGQLFGSECEMKCTGDTLCGPPAVGAPAVCSSDGTLVKAACQAKCDGLEVVEGVDTDCKADEAVDPTLGLPDCGQRCSDAAKDYRCKQAQCDQQGYAPVCGSDGTVYDNLCWAKCQYAEITRLKCSPDVEKKQECADRCIDVANGGDPCGHCDSEPYEPVCTYYGIVVSNPCRAECEDTPVQFACPPAEELETDCSVRCSGIVNVPNCAFCEQSEYAPVCSTDGRYFRNRCYADCEWATINDAVTCEADESKAQDCIDLCLEAAPPPPEACDCDAPSDVQAPVCTYGGDVKQNACAAECAGLVVRETCGELGDAACTARCQELEAIDIPETRDNTTCTCPASVQPVCGSDGRTYQNNCFLTCAAKRYESGRPYMYAGPGTNYWPGMVLWMAFECPDTSEDGVSECADKCRAQRMRPIMYNEMPGSVRPGGDTTASKCPSCNGIIIGAKDKVCGMRGGVFKHQCLAQCAGVKVRWPCTNKPDCWRQCKTAAAAEKVMPGGCQCVELNQPVCAASGTVHPNTCTAVCKGDEPWFECTKLNKQQCIAACSAAVKALAPVQLKQGRAAVCSCSKAPAKPVCAKSGTVYPSECLMKCSRAAKLWDCGKRRNCAADCLSAAAALPAFCASGTKPVCATNGKVAANPCALKAANLKKRWDCGRRNAKACAKDCLAASKPTIIICAKNGKGVCASNGHVYANDCLLKNAKAVKVFDCAGRFDCREDCKVAAKPSSFCGCNSNFAPVCGRSGKVFTNTCLAKCAKAAVRWPCGKRGANCRKLCLSAKGRP